jgi:hypothetical protein
VTEPDPVAALAAQLEELRGEIGSLGARHSDDYGQVMILLLEVKKLREKLDEAMAKRQTAGPDAPCWLGLSRDEHATRLGELREWVDRVARVQWPGYLVKLPPCWANHPEAVWEMANLMTEWARIYDDPDNRPLQDALWFFERWLPGVLSRLAQAVKCDVAGCRLTRSSPWERSPPRYS